MSGAAPDAFVSFVEISPFKREDQVNKRTTGSNTGTPLRNNALVTALRPFPDKA